MTIFYILCQSYSTYIAQNGFVKKI